MQTAAHIITHFTKYLFFVSAWIFLSLAVSYRISYEPVCAEEPPRTLYIQQYGAVGDGITDDTKAVQSALYAAKNEPCTIVFETGKTYILKRDIFLYSNTTLDLNGAVIRDGYEGGVNDEYVLWANGLRFINNPDSAKTGGYEALSNITIKNGTINGIYGSTVSGATFALMHASNITFDHIKFSDCMAGTHVIDLGGCKNVTIRHCQFTGAYIADPSLRYREMIQLDSATYKGMPYWDEYSGACYDELPCENITISDCLFTRGNGTHAPNAIGTHTAYSGASKNITITRNTFYDCYSYAIRFPRVNNLTISENHFLSEGNHYAKKASFIGVIAKNETGISPYCCSKIKICRNVFHQKAEQCVIPVKITGFSECPFSSITIQKNVLTGDYQRKKNSFLWQCKFVDNYKRPAKYLPDLPARRKIPLPDYQNLATSFK